MALCQNRTLISMGSLNPYHHRLHHPSSSLLNLIKKTPASSSSSLLQFKRHLIIGATAFTTANTATAFTTANTATASSSSTMTSIAATATASSSPITADNDTSKWSAFAGNLSGEWDGHGADFTIQGNPIELPESVVPDAYREWEVKVFDWQTQCPTLVEPNEFAAKYKLIKLLPTVGCEADAATRYTVDERKIGGPDNSVSAFAYQSNGSYVAVWAIEDRVPNQLLELEHCLIDPHDRESRVRIIQIVRVENCKLDLKNIRVFVEQWYGPFRNGEQLGGCAIRDSAFASTEALKSSEVTGAWEGSSAVASFQNSHNSILQELLDDSVKKTVRDEHNLVLLPKKLWSSVKEIEDGETCFEVGWLLQQGRALTSKCIFSSNAELKEIVTGRETVVGQ